MEWPKLFEIEDKRWLPRVFRDQITDALRFLIVEMKAYDPIIPEFLWVMQKSQTKNVIDLCSGGTGPWEYLIKAISKPEESVASITLTDLYPNEKALKALSESHPLFRYKAESVNALDIDEDLEGVRTLFSCFHHFDKVEATSIIQSAVDRQMPICVFEFTQRRLIDFFIAPIFIARLFTKLLFAKPLTLSRLLFSYLIPIVPVIYLWDSSVSHLRSYSQEELKEMLNNVSNAESFEWEVGESTSPRTPLKNTFLIGYPKKKKEIKSISGKANQTTVNCI